MKTVSVAVVAGVMGCLLVQAVPAAEVPAREKVLYSFCGQANCADGAYPSAGFINVKGTLYSTTQEGGVGGGTVFAFDRRTGVEKVLYSFCQQPNCVDGDQPVAGLIDVKGVLYGTTNTGGTSVAGNVFAVNTSTGAERVLYSFCGQPSCTDGYFPAGSLIDVNGKLYGTTYFGGTNGQGTVFVVDPSTAAERVLHSFCSQQRCADGQYSVAGLIDVNGTMYGTTVQGGTFGYGTVFSLDPSTGVETVLHSFGSGADGQSPQGANLIDVNGILYGTTAYGGTGDGGTVFALDPQSGAENVLYSFCSQQNCIDGRYPNTSLIDVNGTLYGTTTYGGITADFCPSGCGTVFALDSNTGGETVLHSFCSQQNCTDGALPYAGLVDVNGKLYSTTLFGGGTGCNGLGCGTVFAIKMP